MTVMTIRNVSDEIRSKLRLRAAKAGRSMEAEVRAILAAACQNDEEARPAASLQDWVDKLYGRRKPKRVVDDLIAERRKEAKRE